jgi:hypothetical protein
LGQLSLFDPLPLSSSHFFLPRARLHFFGFLRGLFLLSNTLFVWENITSLWRMGHDVLLLNIEVSEKHAIINFVLSNLSVIDRKLMYSLRKPFDAVLDLALSSSLAPALILELVSKKY